MAAKGYLEAFRLVKQNVALVLRGQNAGAVLRQIIRSGIVVYSANPFVPDFWNRTIWPATAAH